MPRYSRFYSVTEAEAANSFPELCPQQIDAPHFSSDDAEQLASIINGTLTSTSRARNDFHQPLFRPKQQSQSVEQLLNASGFSITHVTVHRDKFVRYESTSEEDSHEWNTRSRTPSSDEPSPRKCRVPSPTLTVKAEASSASEGSDDGMANVATRTHMKQLRYPGTFPDHYTTYPDNVLQNMDTQFSKWSYDLNEGATAVPFVMAQAPVDTHESLVKVDRGFWIKGAEEVTRTAVNSQGTAKIVLERVQKKGSKPLNPSTPTEAPKLKTSNNIDAPSKDDFTSKRAALIAKGRAAKDSLLAVSRSANQRRSAMHKNKNRRSIMPSPPPTARKPEPVKKQEAQTEESRPTVLILDRKEDDQRRDINSALQNQSLDLNNDRQLEALMEQLRSAGADVNEVGRRVTGEIEGTELNSKNAGQAGKTHRPKGKARKKIKSSAA